MSIPVFGSRQDIIDKLLAASSRSPSDECTSTDDDDDEMNDGDRRRLKSTLGQPPPPPPRNRSWRDSEQFFDDNLDEVYAKLSNLEKQIWGKLIVMERNQRTAKAYLRHPIVTIDGSTAEFDGLRVGLARFANIQRSAHVDQMFIDMSDNGIRIKIDTIGNIWAKNMADDDGPMIYVKPLNRTNSNERYVIDQRNVKVFDIQVFKDILAHELRTAEPNRRYLEKCCLVCIQLIDDDRCRSHTDDDDAPLLNAPCWLIIVHLVAIELLNMLLPKDNEISSPSSSFVAVNPLQPIHTATTTRNKLFRKSGGGVMRRIARSVEANQQSSVRRHLPSDDDHPVSHPSIQQQQQHHQSIYNHGVVMVPTSYYLYKNNFGSMVDLRQLNRFQSPVYFDESNRSRGGIGHGRCVPSMAQSIDHLDMIDRREPSRSSQHRPIYASPSNDVDAMTANVIMNKRELIRRWRSQDSGIASGGSR